MSRQKTRPKETPITQYRSDPSTLLDAFHDRPDLDLVREMVGFPYQALIDIEATEEIGAEPHDQKVTRTTRCNGSRANSQTTRPTFVPSWFSARCSESMKPSYTACGSAPRLPRRLPLNGLDGPNSSTVCSH